GEMHDVITRQLQRVKNLDQEIVSHLVIAYEPIWAIGTGKTASAEQAQEVHQFIRNILDKHVGAAISSTLRILYGGSVKTTNAKALLSEKDIDGLLIGGASLKAEDFYTIIQIADQLL
ncbi:MAG: triose-phosphate isomerase, partial [Candidatus Marinimicrobia bacterium]|nr:triose-phosphate isomerase [Candidatus Neomarinimicrobiota bacterium]